MLTSTRPPSPDSPSPDPRRGRGRRSVRLAACTAAVLAAGTVLAGPSLGSDLDEIGDPLPDVEQGPVQVDLDLVTADLVAPLAGVTAPGRPDMLYVVDQVGQLKELDVTAPRPVPSLRTVLDVSGLLVGPVDPKDERGFLGAAFAADGTLYTYTSEAFAPGSDFPLQPDPADSPCDIAGRVADHRSVVREWEVASASPLTFEPVADSRVLLTVDQPQSNHNAGDMAFGPDGMLYIAFGDGGGADDQNCQENFDGTPMFGHGPEGNGQDPTNPLGDILRIDPTGTSAANGQYGIPADNPFAGGNYGWRVREGSFAFTPDEFDLKGSKSDGFPFSRRPAPAGLVDPVAQYDHDDGTAVIGGYVYRGSQSPSLVGQYVFGDTSRRLNNAHGRLFATSGAKTGPHEVVELRDGPLDVQLIGFGQDSALELYAMVFEPGGSGQVLHISD